MRQVVNDLNALTDHPTCAFHSAGTPHVYIYVGVWLQDMIKSYPGVLSADTELVSLPGGCWS